MREVGGQGCLLSRGAIPTATPAHTQPLFTPPSALPNTSLTVHVVHLKGGPEVAEDLGKDAADVGLAVNRRVREGGRGRDGGG